MKLNGRVGCRYDIRYKGGIKGQEPMEDYSCGEPMSFVLGMGQLPPGIEEALCTMDAGDEKIVVLEPDKAFGVRSEKNVAVYPRAMFEFGEELQVGSIVQWDNKKTGQTVPVRIVDANDVAVKADFNHPLAGETLEYWLRVEAVKG